METDGRITLYVIGYPKSGNTWVARLLGDALDSPVASTIPWATTQCIGWEGEDRTGPYRIRYGHSVPTDGKNERIISDHGHLYWQMLTDEKVAFLLRDPRDVLLSVAHHWGLTLEKAIECMDKGIFPIDFGGGYEPHTRAWLNAKFPYVLTRYEWLSEDTEYELTRILHEWGIPHGDLSEVIERQSFDARKAWTKEHGDVLPYGKEFQLRFLRRGKVGAWRDELPKYLQRKTQEIWGQLMLELGYTTGANWYAQP